MPDGGLSHWVYTDPVNPCAMTIPENPRIIKLPPNGPKPGQSLSSWLYGKERAHQKATGTAVWKKRP